MDIVQLKNVVKEKDLGIIVSTDLKPKLQCTEVVKTANKLVSFIGRAFEFKSEKFILTLYNSLVHLLRLHNKPYNKRLKKLNLFSLTKHRLRGDLLTKLKIFKRFINLKPDDYSTFNCSSITCNNGFKIIGKRFITNKAKYFFFNLVVNIWNGLSQNVVNSSTEV